MAKVINLTPSAPWQEVRSTAKDWDELGAGALGQMLHHLHLIRAFEETVLELDGQGLVHGPAHSSIGQEGGAVGVMAELNSGDQITGAHRGHHQFLAKCLRHVDPANYDPRKQMVPAPIKELLYRTLAEILGLSDGFCKGRGGSMHLRWTEAGAMGTNAIVGGGVPIANGLAWAKKRQGKGNVAFTFFGDGAVNIGAVPESMNLAALWNLPICFFIENNPYAMSTTVSEETRETLMSSPGAAHGMPAFRVARTSRLAVRLPPLFALGVVRLCRGSTSVAAAAPLVEARGPPCGTPSARPPGRCFEPGMATLTSHVRRARPRDSFTPDRADARCLAPATSRSAMK